MPSYKVYSGVTKLRIADRGTYMFFCQKRNKIEKNNSIKKNNNKQKPYTVRNFVFGSKEY